MVQTGDRILIEAGRVKRGFNHIHETAFKPRQQIRVLDGPFAGFDGLFMAAAGEDRIKIMLDIFGRNTSLEIDEASVEAVA